MKSTSFFYKIKENIAGNLVVKGTLILALAGFSTRIIGFYNRIFLSDLIGATEIGIYQLILPLYMVVFAFTVSGNEFALTKLVSEYKSRNDYATIQKLFRLCILINLTSSLTISSIMYQNASWLCARILNAPACTPCLKILCIGMPFMSTKGAIHGYFLGLEKSSVHGISDFLEQTAKVLGLYLLSTYICIQNNYDAAFAVWGIVFGELIAFAYSVSAYIYHSKKNKHLYSTQKPAIYFRQICTIFFKNSIPFTTNRLALTVLQSMESIMIPTVLFMYYNDSATSLAHYGVFTGMAFPFIMFPSTITNALSTMLLPAVSSAHSALKQNHLSTLCEKSMHFCLLIGIFSSIVFYIFGADIGMAFFQNKEAGMYLYQLSFLCPLIYLATTLASILNGLGYTAHNLLLTVIATIIRISFIQIVIPKIGIAGYIIGLFTSYLFLTFTCLHKLQKEVTFQLHFLENIFLPCCAFTIIGSCFFYLYQRLLPFFSENTQFQIVLLLGIVMCFGVISILPFFKTIYKTPKQPD